MIDAKHIPIPFEVPEAARKNYCQNLIYSVIVKNSGVDAAMKRYQQTE
jgi:hypothetical protein